MNPRFLCRVNLPAQVHLVANSPSHFSAWGLMSFRVDGECISSVHFSSCQQTCAWEKAAGVYLGHNQQIEPCHCLEMVSVSATLTPSSAAEEWGFMNGCLKNQEQWGLWVLGYSRPYLLLTPLSSPHNILFFSRNLILLRFYSVGKVIPSLHQRWIMSNLSL